MSDLNVKRRCEHFPTIGFDILYFSLVVNLLNNVDYRPASRSLARSLGQATNLEAIFRLLNIDVGLANAKRCKTDEKQTNRELC